MKRIVSLAMLCLALCPAVTSAQSVTLTTYYPAPFGAYDRLRLVPRAALAAGCDDGLLHTDSATGDIRFCRGSVWEPIDSIWRRPNMGNDIYLNDTANTQQVGLRTTTPSALFDINTVGGDTAGAALGTNMWWHMGDTALDRHIWFQDSSTAPAGPTLSIQAANTPGKIVFRQTGSGSAGPAGAPEYSSWIGHAAAGSDDIALIGGNVGIGQTAPIYKLEIDGEVAIRPTDATQTKLIFESGDAFVMGIDSADLNRFKINQGINFSNTTSLILENTGDITINGAITINDGVDTGLLRLRYVNDADLSDGDDSGWYPAFAPPEV